MKQRYEIKLWLPTDSGLDGPPTPQSIKKYTNNLENAVYLAKKLITEPKYKTMAKHWQIIKETIDEETFTFEKEIVIKKGE